jgi:hypothetical protein
MTSTVWIDHLREREEVFAAKSAGQGNAPAGAAEGRSAGSSPEKSDAPVQADGIVSLERKRADWLMTLMAADPKLTPYRIYQCGGPAKETLKLILDGKRVEPTTIKKLVSALQRAEVWTGERPISMEDIPK